MNDPTNWNIDPSIKSIEVEDPAMAKEMERRWNAFPGLVAALDAAAYALFETKRLVDAGPVTREHVRTAHAKACDVLNRVK